MNPLGELRDTGIISSAEVHTGVMENILNMKNTSTKRNVHLKLHARLNRPLAIIQLTAAEVLAVSLSGKSSESRASTSTIEGEAARFGRSLTLPACAGASRIALVDDLLSRSVDALRVRFTLAK
jgi:hypothetical protein